MHNTDLLSSAQLRKLFGSVSLMSIWRWLRLPNDPLPPPAAVVGRRRYWRRADVDSWLARRAPAERGGRHV